MNNFSDKTFIFRNCETGNLVELGDFALDYAHCFRAVVRRLMSWALSCLTVNSQVARCGGQQTRRRRGDAADQIARESEHKNGRTRCKEQGGGLVIIWQQQNQNSPPLPINNTPIISRVCVKVRSVRRGAGFSA